jgi:hypothetical protein
MNKKQNTIFSWEAKKVFTRAVFTIFLWIFLWAFSLSLAQIIVVTPKSEIEAANDLAKRWIINNHRNNIKLYNLDKKVLRQEIAAVTRWVAKIEKAKKCENIFKDLTNILPNTWACLNVEALVKNNFLAKNTFFRPEENITKAESLWMLIKAIWFDYKFDKNNSKSWQEQVVDFAVEKGIIERFNDFNSFATRWFVFKIADVKLVEKKEEKKVKIKIKQDDLFSDEAKIK